MQRFVGTVLVFCALAAGCGGKGNPSEPSSSTGQSSSSSSGPATPVAGSPAPDNTGNTQQAEIKGTIDTVTGSAASFQFKMGSRVVKGDGATTFTGSDHPASFSDLKDGVEVEVKGQQADGFVKAAQIEVENENRNDDGNNPPQPPPPPQQPPPQQPPQNQEAQITGTLTAIGGAAPALTLTVNGSTVHTSSSTTVKQRGNPVTLAALQVRQTLEVEGTRRSDGSVDARSISIEDGNDNENEQNEVELTGTMSGLTGACPALSFTVNGRSITTNASTQFDKTPCSGFKNGDRVEVKGNGPSNGAVVATRVRKEN